MHLWQLFPSSKIVFWPFLKLQKNGIDLFEFTSFFGLDFFKFSGPLCILMNFVMFSRKNVFFSLPPTVHSEFELEYLLLEGHCFEAYTGNPPRGLQLTLGTKHEPVVMDTIVMANLGYLQLKSSPGRWLLGLREGRSADIYDIGKKHALKIYD